MNEDNENINKIDNDNGKTLVFVYRKFVLTLNSHF